PVALKVGLVGAHRDFVLGAAVDVVEERSRQPPPRSLPEVVDSDDHAESLLLVGPVARTLMPRWRYVAASASSLSPRPSSLLGDLAVRPRIDGRIVRPGALAVLAGAQHRRWPPQVTGVACEPSFVRPAVSGVSVSAMRRLSSGSSAGRGCTPLRRHAGGSRPEWSEGGP